MRIEFVKHEQQRKYPGKKTKPPPQNVGACWTIQKELKFVFSRLQKVRRKKIEKVSEKIMVRNFKFGEKLQIHTSTDLRSQGKPR